MVELIGQAVIAAGAVLLGVVFWLAALWNRKGLDGDGDGGVS